MRPKLEFAVAAWSPWLEKDIGILEKIQERAIRQLSDVKRESYEERCRDAGVTTLRERRIRGDLIEVFKTLKGFNKVRKNEWFSIQQESARPTRANTNIEDDGRDTRRTDILNRDGARLEVRRNFFTVRVVRYWNQLPEEVKEQRTINAFKNRLDEWTRSNAFAEE